MFKINLRKTEIVFPEIGDKYYFKDKKNAFEVVQVFKTVIKWQSSLDLSHVFSEKKTEFKRDIRNGHWKKVK